MERAMVSIVRRALVNARAQSLSVGTHVLVSIGEPALKELARTSFHMCFRAHCPRNRQFCMYLLYTPSQKPFVLYCVFVQTVATSRKS